MGHSLLYMPGFCTSSSRPGPDARSAAVQGSETDRRTRQLTSGTTGEWRSAATTPTCSESSSDTRPAHPARPRFFYRFCLSHRRRWLFRCRLIMSSLLDFLPLVGRSWLPSQCISPRGLDHGNPVMIDD